MSNRQSAPPAALPAAARGRDALADPAVCGVHLSDLPGGGGPSGRSASRLPWVLLLALLLAGAAAWVWRFDPELSFYGDDDANYLILGKAISLGRGYRMITDPLEPLNTNYPPGYPLLIAGAAAAMGQPSLRDLLWGVKFLGLALWAGAVCSFFGLERRREGLLVAAAATALFALHPEILRMAGEAMSEVPFLCFSLLGLWAFDRLLPPPETGRGAGSARVVLVAAALTWPVYIRTIGVALPLAAVLLLAWRRRLRQAVLLGAACALLFVPFALQSRSVAGATIRGTHLQDLLTKERPFAATSSAELYTEGGPEGSSRTNVGEVLGRVRVAFWYYRRALPTVAVYTGSTDVMDLPLAVSFLGLALLLAGCWARLRAGLTLSEVYVALYMGVLCLWPFRYERLLVPILPFLILYGVKGVEVWSAAAARLAPRAARRPMVASAIVLASAFTLAVGYPRQAAEAAEAALPLEARPWTPRWIVGYMDATVWIARSAAPEAVVFCLRPRHMSVVTGHKAGTYLVASPAELVRRIRSHRRSYVVEDESSFAKRYLRPALDVLERSGEVRLVHAGAARGATRVWLVPGDPGGRRGGGAG